MSFLLDPNIAYVLVVGCVLLVLVAIVSPHTIIVEGTLVVCLILTGYEVYLRGINLWAAALLVVSIVPFLLSVQTNRWDLPLLGLTLALLAGGSLFLFTDARGMPAVNPLLAAFVSIVSGISIWFCARLAAAALRRVPFINPDGLVGQTGEARTEIRAHGTVQAGGEMWSARSEKPIEAGSAVRVMRREGFVLIVEKETK